MKNNCRKFVLFIVIQVCAILVLSACDERTSLESIAGKSFDVNTKNIEMSFTFDNDGSVEIGLEKEGPVTGEYYQDRENVKIEVYGYVYNCTYDGKNFEIISEGFIEDGKEKDYVEQIKSDEVLTFTHEDIEREYVLHLPDNYENAPLVLVLHGFGGDVSIEDSYMGFSEVGNKNNFVVCYPQGLSGSEKDGTYWNANWGLEEDADDIDFLSTLAKYLVKEYNLNEDRVYACGFSNGGFMGYTLALNASDVFKKVAVISGLMSQYDWQNKDDASPTPILHIHGVEDNVIEIENSEHYNMSVDEIIDFWSKKNNCNQLTEEKLGSNTTVYRYTGGEADVWYYKVDNWGHELPNKDWTDFSAAEIIWRFFDN